MGQPNAVERHFDLINRVHTNPLTVLLKDALLHPCVIPLRMAKVKNVFVDQAFLLDEKQFQIE